MPCAKTVGLVLVLLDAADQTDDVDGIFSFGDLPSEFPPMRRPLDPLRIYAVTHDESFPDRFVSVSALVRWSSSLSIVEESSMQCRMRSV
jgi:hypothetical protein